jgi:hypothetical protein
MVPSIGGSRPQLELRFSTDSGRAPTTRSLDCFDFSIDDDGALRLARGAIVYMTLKSDWNAPR